MITVNLVNQFESKLDHAILSIITTQLSLKSKLDHAILSIIRLHFSLPKNP